jgi:hypothetical protein
MSYFSKPLFAALALTALGSCASRDRSEVGTQAYNQALSRAFDEMKARSPDGRDLASEQSLAALAGADLSKLRGSIEVVVFPKFSSLGDKNASAVHVDFGRPTTYTFNVVRNLACQKLVKENSAKWAHRDNFKDASADLDCAILRVVQSEPKRLVANVRQGDIKEAHLYLDSEYSVYGFDYEIMRTRRDSEVVHVKTDATAASGSSGLGMLPIDLPPSNPALAVVSDDQPVRASADAFVTRKLQELKVSFSCARGKRISYKDSYGQRNTTQWCKGDVWPTVVENDRFVAVLKRGK